MLLLGSEVIYSTVHTTTIPTASWDLFLASIYYVHVSEKKKEKKEARG